MERFKTESGSVYELDWDNKRIRRVTGIKDPTPRQGKDGDWKEYLYVSSIIIGQSVVICWKIEETDQGSVHRTTMTSRIVEKS